jgi:putative transposase
MTRLARMVVSGLPHHVTQRGNRRESIFLEDGDQEIYRDLLGEQVRKADVEVWAYCLTPNHVHLFLNPRQAHGVGRAVGEAHRRYTNFINARGRWTGHLFQSRFASVAMDESHLISAFCYVSLNPVGARLRNAGLQRRLMLCLRPKSRPSHRTKPGDGRTPYRHDYSYKMFASPQGAF